MKATARGAALCAVTLLLAGCAHGERTVSIRTLQSNVSFGAPSPGATPSAAVAVPGIVTPAGPSLPSYAFGPSPASFDYGTTTQPAPPACPVAGLGAFPKQAAPLTVTQPPAAGFWRWKTVRPVKIGSLTSTVTTFDDHEIRAVSKVTETANTADGGSTRTFTFDEVQPSTSGSQVTTYRVVTNPTTLDLEIGAPQLNRVVGGQPDRGISIVKVVNLDAKGNQVASFAPSPAVLIMPLDVLAPQDFTGTGTDPLSGAALTVKGTLTKRERVDACGEPVDGWAVEATTSFVNRGATTASTVHYDFATQLGGMLTEVEVTPTGETAPTTLSLARATVRHEAS